MVIKKFMKDNFWPIVTVFCLIVLGVAVRAVVQEALDVVIYYVTHALIAD